VTGTRSHPALTKHTTVDGRGMTARVRAFAGRLSDRIHAAADDRARALGWQVTPTPGRLGLTGRSYRDPRFAARRQVLQDAPAARGERHG
jgi:hypothetical protein